MLLCVNVFSYLFPFQQIQHPTASLIAKVATAQDDITGDGTTSNVLIIGELLKQADLYISEVRQLIVFACIWHASLSRRSFHPHFLLLLQGLHPRIIAEGFEAAKEKALAVLEEVKVTQEMDRETLINVARTSLRTKVHAELADLLTEVRCEGIEFSINLQHKAVIVFLDVVTFR